MIKLSKFYDLISRNATVTLLNTDRSETYYEGSVKDIPDMFDNIEVIDFAALDNGDYIFDVSPYRDITDNYSLAESEKQNRLSQIREELEIFALTDEEYRAMGTTKEEALEKAMDKFRKFFYK